MPSLKITAENAFFHSHFCLIFINFHHFKRYAQVTFWHPSRKQLTGALVTWPQAAAQLEKITWPGLLCPHGRCAAMSSSPSPSSSLLSPLWAILPDGTHPWRGRADREHLFNAFRLKGPQLEPCAGQKDEWKVSCAWMHVVFCGVFFQLDLGQ